MYGPKCDELVKMPIKMYEPAKLRGGIARERVNNSVRRLLSAPKTKMVRIVETKRALNGQTFVSSKMNQPMTRSKMAKAMQVRRAMPPTCHAPKVSAIGR